MTTEGQDPRPLPIAEREVERLRLLLSTYQDGTGQYGGGQEPGWRDFERAVALTFTGAAQESKSVFDVLIPHPTLAGAYYGISCKMRETLDFTFRTNKVVVEVSNASAKFGTVIERYGFGQTLLEYPKEVGRLVLNLIESWVAEASLENNGLVLYRT